MNLNDYLWNVYDTVDNENLSLLYVTKNDDYNLVEFIKFHF